MSSKQMYAVQVGVASIFSSGSGQLYLRSVTQWNTFTVCQHWLLTTYLRLATISGWPQRNIWFADLLSYPGLYFNASKLCTC